MDAPLESLFDLSTYVDAFEQAYDSSAAPWPARADERVRAYDARIAERLQAGEQQLLKGLSARGLTLRHNVELNLKHDLHRVIRFFLKFWRVGDYLAVDGFDPTVTFCETLDEFVAAALQARHLSDWLKAGEIKRLKANMEDRASKTGGRGMKGFYLFGDGSYLNGWLLNYNLPPPARGLLKKRDSFERVLSVALHEALGHGFFEEFSALGQENESIGGSALELAQTFHLRLADSPRHTLLLNKWRMVNHASLFLHEGWTTWLENLLTPSLLGQPRRAQYTLAQLWNAIELWPHPPRDRDAARGALHQIFIQPPAEPRDLFVPVRILQAFISSDTRGLPQPLEYVFGSLLFDRLEANAGLLNVPRAMLTAANLKFELETISTVELYQLLRSEPRFNADWRLMALSGLQLPAPVAWPDLAHAAQEQLNLAAL